MTGAKLVGWWIVLYKLFNSIGFFNKIFLFFTYRNKYELAKPLG